MEDNIQKTGKLNWRSLQELNNEVQKRNTLDDALTMSRALRSASPTQLHDIFPTGQVVTDEQAEAIGLGDSSFDKKITTLSDLNDLNEFRTQQQNRWQQLGAGFGKALVLTGTTFADTFAGTVAGILNIGAEALEGNINSGNDVLNAFVNNPVSQTLQNINEWSEKVLPNYYTREEQNRSWWQNLGTANFWGDHFVKNLGFFVGAYLSGRATAGLLTKAMKVNEAKKIFEGAVKTATGTTMEGTEAINAVLSGSVQLTDEALTSGLTRAARALKNEQIAVKVISSIMGAMGESRIEAITGSDDYFDKIKTNLDNVTENALSHAEDLVYDEHPEWFSLAADIDNEGRIKGYKRVTSNIKAEQVIQQKTKEIQDKYEDALKKLADQKIRYANTTFLMNMAVLASDYAFQFGDAFVGGFGKARVATGLVDLINGKYKQMAGKEIAKAIGGAVLSPIAEGTQEMFQEAIQKSAESYYGNKINKFYGDILNPEAMDSANNYLMEFVNQLGNVYSDPEEWENFALGAITALVGMPGMTEVRDEQGNVVKDDNGRAKKKLQWQGEFYEGLRNAREIRKQAALDEKALNDLLVDDDKRAMYYNLVRQVINTDRQQRAIVDGDAKAYKDAEYDKLVSRALTYIETGRYEDLLDEIDKIYTIDKKDIKEIKTITMDKETGKSIFDGKTQNEIIEAFKQQKEQLLKKVEHIKEVSDNLNRIYGNVFSRQGYNNLVSLATTVDDREERIKQISQDVLDFFNENIAVANRVGSNRLKTINDIRDLAIYIKRDGKKSRLDKLNESRKRAVESGAAAYEQEKAQRVADDAIVERDEVTEETQTTLGRALRVLNEVTEIVKNGDKPLEMPSKLYDLAELLKEREQLVHAINDYSQNPLEFEESLRDRIADSVNAYNDKIINTRYKKFKALESLEEKVSELKNNPVSQTILAKYKEMAKKDNDNTTLDAINEFEKIVKEYIRDNSILEKYLDDADMGQQFGVLKTMFDGVANEASTLEEYQNKTKEILDLARKGKVFGGDTDAVIDIFEKEVENKKKSQAALDEGKKKKKKKSGSGESKKIDKNIADAVNKLFNAKDLDAAVQNLDKNAIIKLFGDDILANASGVEELSMEDFAGMDVDTLREMLAVGIEDLKQQGFDSYEEAVKSTEDNEEESTDDEDTEEEERDTKRNRRNKRDSSVDDEDDSDDNDETEDGEVEISSDGAESEKSEQSSGKKKKPITQIKNLKKNSKAKENNGEGQQSAGKDVDAWTVNVQGAKYDIDSLKDRNKRKATVSNQHWAREYLDLCKAQEFIDSGELAQLIARYKEAGIPLRFRFVTIKTDKNNKDINIKQNNTVFVALEVPNGYTIKNGSPSNALTIGIDNNQVKVQLLGVVSSKEEEFRDLRRQIISEQKKILDANGIEKKSDINNFVVVASEYTTNVEMVFSGRMVKSNDRFEDVETRPLLDIVEKDSDGKPKSLNKKIQLVVKKHTDDIVIGDDLGGEIVPLNDYRAQNDIVSDDVKDRAGTPWIRVREADGKVYHKAISVRNFDESYTDDDSHYAKRIKNALGKLVSAKNAKERQSAINQLSQYIYIPRGKSFKINPSTNTFRKGNIQVDMSASDAVEQLYDALKQIGYKFTFGNNNDSIDAIVDSNIFETDLAQIRNANASLLVSRVVVNKDGYDIIPSQVVAEHIATGAAHTGSVEFDSNRNYGPRIQFEDNGLKYCQRGSGKDATFWIDKGGTFEEVDDDNLKFQIAFATAIHNKTIKPLKQKNGKAYYISVKGERGKKSIYKMKDKHGNDRYMTSSYHLLTNEEIVKFNKLVKGIARNDDAKEALDKQSKEDTIEQGDKTKQDTKNKEGEGQANDGSEIKPSVNLPGITRRKKSGGTQEINDVQKEFSDKLEKLSNQVNAKRLFFEFKRKYYPDTPFVDVVDKIASKTTKEDLDALNSIDVKNPDEVKAFFQYLEAKENCMS